MSQTVKENCDLSDNETSDTKSESIVQQSTTPVPVKNDKTAGRLTFSISRLLECHPPADIRRDSKDTKLVEIEEDENADNEDDKSSISSSIDCDSPMSAYSNYRAEHTKENQAAYLQSAIEAGHLGLIDAANNSASHTSSPTNSVIRVPAHRPPPSSALPYGVGYPWINQPPGSFIKEGLSGKFVIIESIGNELRVVKASEDMHVPLTFVPSSC